MSKDFELNSQNENKAVRKLVLYIFGIVLISTLMLAFNTGLIFSLAFGLKNFLPAFPGSNEFIQLIIYLGPVILLYFEWYAWDVLTSGRIR